MSSDLFSASQGKLNVLSFAAEDLVLRKRVLDALETEAPKDARAASERLRTRLRVVYPRAEVRVRDPLAGFGEPTLYVFRDGGITSALGSQTWVEDPGIARLVTDASGLYVEANQAAAIQSLDSVASSLMPGSPTSPFASQSRKPWPTRCRASMLST